MIRRVGLTALEVLAPVVLLVIWWFASESTQSIYILSLRDDLRAFRQTWLWEHFRPDLLPSVINFLIGFAIAILVGVALGVLLGLSARLRRDLSPITEFFRATPIAALVPVGLIILGPGRSMEVALIAFGSVWPILVSTTDGVRSSDEIMLDTARVYGLSRRQRIFSVTLPSALPQIFAGTRIALALGIAVMIISNSSGSSSGLGFFLVNAQQSFDIGGTWAALLMIGLVGCLANIVLLAVQRPMLAWHRGWRASIGGSK